jgi:phosphoglycerol transferase
MNKDIHYSMKEFGLYATTIVVGMLVLTYFLQLWNADFRVALYHSLDGDNTFVLLLVKSTIEYGWYFTNPRLGAPGTMDLHDFPMLDTLHFLTIKGMGSFTADPALILNLYYLGGYLLALATSLFVLRHFEVSRPVSAATSILFAFQPYHFWRGPWHLFLAAYQMVPLAVMVSIWICRGAPFIVRTSVDGKRTLRPTAKGIAAVGILAVVSMTGIYYAFFTGILLAASSLRAYFRRPSTARILGLGLLCTAFAASALAQAAPYVAYRRSHGKNPVIVRSPSEVRYYSLDLFYLLRPGLGHRVPLLRGTETYQIDEEKGPLRERLLNIQEARLGSIGILGALGYLTLTVSLLGVGSALVAKYRPLGELALLNAVATMSALSGGFGTIVASLAFPEIRAYNRISIFIAFLSLFALALLADRLKERLNFSRLGRVTILLGLVVITIAGLYDQAPAMIAPDHHKDRAIDASDKVFVAKVEAALPAASQIFQLPFNIFPEGPIQNDLGGYAQLRPSLYSRTLRWSFGAMKGREASEWSRKTSALPVRSMLAELRRKGFAGVIVHRAGYKDLGRSLEASLQDELGSETIVSDNGEVVLFPIGIERP